jgi:hypothetical protein
MAYTEEFEVSEYEIDRSFKVDNNVLHVRRHDPYGFWLCHYEKGTVPAELTGSYTSFYEAEKAVLSYLERRAEKNTPKAA